MFQSSGSRCYARIVEQNIKPILLDNGRHLVHQITVTVVVGHICHSWSRRKLINWSIWFKWIHTQLQDVQILMLFGQFFQFLSKWREKKNIQKSNLHTKLPVRRKYLSGVDISERQNQSSHTLIPTVQVPIEASSLNLTHAPTPPANGTHWNKTSNRHATLFPFHAWFIDAELSKCQQQ